MGKQRTTKAAPTTVNSSVRTREYLTAAEVERLMTAARASSRYGHRDATMILSATGTACAHRNCALQWSQVELTPAASTSAERSRARPASIPCGATKSAPCGVCARAGRSPHVFVTERAGPLTPKAFHGVREIVARAKMPFPLHPHMLRHDRLQARPTTARTPGRCSTTSATRTSSTRCATPSLRRRFKNFWR